MKNLKTRRFVDLGKSPTNARLICVITEEMIQNMAESNWKRSLTDLEMNRLYESFTVDDEVMNSRDSMMMDAIFSAVDNKNNQWTGIDEEFIHSQQKKK